ncbi:modulator of FtsH protease [Roseateles asaccharophilus]|uniref:Modulator of FtsH protease n=1 Tax=Roseateles asaccharophilus TaxID=582607 RepID=A0A4R6NA45_9BURK|nr:Bax inhibitor-1 family protein [Roseateles asaccharophilus]TDP12137.1 modulator of FtsH protease [Roseateles asaccharophilus]
MNESLQNQYGAAYGSALASDRQRVLRNTYWLLALSMVPTVLGAWIGVSTGIMAKLGFGLSTLIFFVGAFGLMFVVEKTKNSSTSVVALLGFTFFMGLMLSRLLAQILGFKNGASLIMTAFGGTAAIFFAMASLATVIKRDLSGLGKFLFVGAIIMLVAGLVNIFLQSSALMLTLLVLSMAVFSAFMLYDIKRVLDGGETNLLRPPPALFLGLYNRFPGPPSPVGFFWGERD